jgi:hypothetical protein
VFLAALLALLSGCAILDHFGLAPSVFAFSHAIHSEAEMDFACVECHPGADDADEPGQPDPLVCAGCHAYVDTSKPPERRVDALFDGDDYRAARVSLLDDEVVFSHKDHVRAVDDCGACHDGIEENEVVTAALGVTMAACEQCHDDERLDPACATCHLEVDEEWMPPTHETAWTELHGPTVRARERATVQQCDICHGGQQYCTDCHLSTPPSNHDDFFRRRGHSLYARLDRDNCAACHDASSCDRCHREVLPTNHVGQFGSPVNNHCVGCHQPLRPESGCMACHRTTPSHDLAPPKPSWHSPTMNCRQCHFPGAPGVGLTHRDNGDDCNSCHL